VGSALKVRSPEAKTLIDKIKAEIKKRAELKAQRMLLKEPKGIGGDEITVMPTGNNGADERGLDRLILPG
jgi:hypothetical protein